MHALAGMLVSPGEGEGDTVLLSKIKARRRFNGDGVEEGRDRHATPRKFRLVGSRPACWIITCHDTTTYPRERSVIYGFHSRCRSGRCQRLRFVLGRTLKRLVQSRFFSLQSPSIVCPWIMRKRGEDEVGREFETFLFGRNSIIVLDCRKIEYLEKVENLKLGSFFSFPLRKLYSWLWRNWDWRNLKFGWYLEERITEAS